jgi:hypothetical protein
MIPVCFAQEMTIGYDDGTAGRLLPFVPAVRADGNTVLDPHRVYLAMEETVQGIVQGTLRPPLLLAREILGKLAGMPVPVAELLAGRVLPARSGQLRVCLVNGGGGGLGDGILFAPALTVLAERLQRLTGETPRLVVTSMMPQRTRVVLGAVPGIEVRPMPMSLAEFMGFDAFADMSGMLEDPGFQQTHMTDFALQRLGIDPAGVAAGEKRPLLRLTAEVPPAVAAALAQARDRACGRPLAALIFISSYTRSLPRPQAAALVRGLAGAGFLPVLLIPEGHAAGEFVTRYGLAQTVVDLSAASRSFIDYFLLLAGMDAIVSVDTSAVHVGAALGKPTVGLFNSINMAYRIRYSPTVHGIQLAYRGRKCQAPCGLSKARAFVEGKLPGGRPFRLECGYACDEAVAREKILADAIAAIRAMDGAGDVAAQYEAIRREVAERLHAALSPCWSALDEEAVVGALQRMMVGKTAVVKRDL